MMTSPLTSAIPSARNNAVDLDGIVHYVEMDGPSQSPPLVLVHGLGGSHVDWMAVAPSLSRRARVLMIDLVGHGFTPCGSRPAVIESHRRLLSAFLQQVSGTPAVLVGNSMGGLVSALQAAQEPETVAGLVLIDPALPTGRTGKVNPKILLSFLLCLVPGLGEWYLHWRRRHSTAEREVRRAFDAICFDPSRVPSAAIDAQVELSRRLDRRETDVAYLQSTRSLCSMLMRPGSSRWTLGAISVPVLLLHGQRDTLVPLSAARAMALAHPDWSIRVAPDVGHVPMLEVPGWTVDQITEWLDLLTPKAG